MERPDNMTEARDRIYGISAAKERRAKASRTSNKRAKGGDEAGE